MPGEWSHDKLVSLLDTIQEGVFVIDRNSRITFFNRAAERITGTSRKHALGRFCHEVLRATCCSTECPLRKTMDTGELFSERPVTLISADGTRKEVSIATTVLRDSAGTITEAIETFRDISSEDPKRPGMLPAGRTHNIVTINPRLQKIISTLPIIAESNSTVLLQGESGTGKELFARALHRLSPRRDKPFLAVNCGALPDNLLESELFGYKAGAFTDAKKDRPGRFARAEGGTLLLDEIGDTSPAMQVKLLRVLQEKRYEPLGSTRSIPANVRIIAASNRDLTELMKQERFRSDLYYRLNVITITIPPLRDRREDIPLLIDYFIDTLNKRQNKRIRGVDEHAMASLTAYDFPGNIRELENTIEHAFVMCRKGYIEKRHLPGAFHSSGAPFESDPGGASLKGIEAALITNALKRNKWDRTRTAACLGMHRSSLYRKMHALGISPSPRRSRAVGHRKE